MHASLRSILGLSVFGLLLIWSGLPERLGFIILRWGIETVLSGDYSRFRRVKLGWTKTEVIASLGKPLRVFHAGATPAQYAFSSYQRPERIVSQTVYCYAGSEPVAYIFFNDSHRVEAVEIIGS